MRVRGKHEFDNPPEVNSGDQIPGVHVTTADPTATDDSAAGYYQGYIWLATTSGGAFICEDATATSAVWTQFDGAGTAGFSEVSKNSGAAVNVAQRTNLNFIEGTNVTITIADDAGGDEVDITIASTGGGGSSRVASSWTTTDDTSTLLDAIDTLTNSGTHIIEVFVTARETSSNSQWGVWKRTLAVTQFSGTVAIQQVSSDMDKQSTGLVPNDVAFAVSGTSVNINVTGIASTTIDWDSQYEIISVS